uniref:Uncharacterized protein n=1 Tax=Meloidogyne enterolobii TaxID=390850 RepID=A0A6V7XG75_MELEN|nr:unnamed protein product [Meloidogyne enterolobii]
MEDIFTRVILENENIKSKQIFLGKDAKLIDEYLFRVDKGAYLHKYAGLWALGLDLLPTSEEQNLHLFVYKGCACSINVWFKNPSIQESFEPKITQGARTGHKNCSARYTSNNFHKLGNIKDEEKIVRFSIWASNNGSRGAIGFINSTDIFLEIELIGREIILFPYMVIFR